MIQSLVLYCMLTVLTIAQNASQADADARAAIAVILAMQQQPADKAEPPKPKFLSYREAAALAVKEGKPLVLFVGCTPRNIDGVIVGYTPDENGQTNYIVVAVSNGRGWLSRWATLSSIATDLDIRNRIPASTSFVPELFPNCPT